MPFPEGLLRCTALTSVDVSEHADVLDWGGPPRKSLHCRSVMDIHFHKTCTCQDVAPSNAISSKSSIHILCVLQRLQQLL